MLSARNILVVFSGHGSSVLFSTLVQEHTHSPYPLHLVQPHFWTNPEIAIRNAYRSTDKFILENSTRLGPGGSTAVTAIVIDGKDLWIANIGDSRAVVCERGSANQLTVDHEPSNERKRIEKQGGFVTTLPGMCFFFFLTDGSFLVILVIISIVSLVGLMCPFFFFI